MQSKNLAIAIWQPCNQVREIAEATRQIGNMELTEMVAALMGAKDAVPYNAFSECHFHPIVRKANQPVEYHKSILQNLAHDWMDNAVLVYVFF